VDTSSIKGDGNGITFSFRPYDGSSAGVGYEPSAPIPDNINLAPTWGNNAQGYRTLSQAGKTVNVIAAATMVVSGGNVAMMAAGAIGGTGLTTIAGEDGVDLLGNQAINRMIVRLNVNCLKTFLRAGNFRRDCPSDLYSFTGKLLKEQLRQAKMNWVCRQNGSK
jgi:hypothetical protein